MGQQREAWFDHTKGILIILVVLGHFLGSYYLIESNTYIQILYANIYFFHMPLFILLAGYFYNPNKPERVLNFVFIYLVWQVFNEILNGYFADYQLLPLNYQKLLDIFNPNWTLWYLAGIIIWFVITPYVLKYKYPLLIVILIALVAGEIEKIPKAFALRRVLMFYPFFLMGYYARNKNWLYSMPGLLQVIKKLRWFIVLGTFGYISYQTYIGELKASRFFMKFSYEGYELGAIDGVISQIVLFAWMFLFCFAFLFIVPRKKPIGWLSNFGTQSLFIYLTHTMFVRVFKHTIGLKYGDQDLTLIAFAVAATVFYLLIFKFLRFDLLFKPVIQPKLNWLYN